MEMKTCIVKLGADGDVLRTIPLAKAMYSATKAEITWITRGDIATLLEGLPYIHQVIQLEDVAEIEEEEFDALYNFDVDEQALELAEALLAQKKYGFHDDAGYPVAYNAGGEYYLNTMFDDELKKKNTKTYQEMMFDVAELAVTKEVFELSLKKEDRNYAEDFVAKNDLKAKKIIGIHMGASSRWPSKAWHPQRVKEFIHLAKNHQYEIIVFGGSNEVEKHTQMIEELNKEGLKVYRNDPQNTKKEFASLVSLCNSMVCADSFALHVAIGLHKKTIALFFVTSPTEVEGYGLLTKIVSPQLKEFFPEKSDQYNEDLVKSISAEEVMNAVKNTL